MERKEAMKTLTALILAGLLLLGFAGALWADAVYVLQGWVKNYSTGIGENGCTVYVSEAKGAGCQWYAASTTVTSSITTCGDRYPASGEGPGVYRVESDQSGYKYCTDQNHVYAEKNIGGTWYRGGAACVWMGVPQDCACGRSDFTIYSGSGIPDCSTLCFETK
jgi:hypothetical protein